MVTRCFIAPRYAPKTEGHLTEVPFCMVPNIDGSRSVWRRTLLRHHQAGVASEDTTTLRPVKTRSKKKSKEKKIAKDTIIKTMPAAPWRKP
jgi:hypothetical protein